MTVCLVQTASSALQASEYNVPLDSTRLVKLTTARPVHLDTTVPTQELALPLPVRVANIQTNRQRLAYNVQLTTPRHVVKQAALLWLQASISPRQVLNTPVLPNAVKLPLVTGGTMVAPFVLMDTFALKRVSSIGGSKVALVDHTA